MTLFQHATAISNLAHLLKSSLDGKGTKLPAYDPKNIDDSYESGVGLIKVTNCAEMKDARWIAKYSDFEFEWECFDKAVYQIHGQYSV